MVTLISSPRWLFSYYTLSWPLFELDVKNVFLRSDLLEEIYMEQSLGFVSRGESSRLVRDLCKSFYGLMQSPRVLFGRFTTCEADHLLFYCHTTVGCIDLVVYDDGIVLIDSDHHDIL